MTIPFDLCDADPQALSIEAALQRLYDHLPIVRHCESIPLARAFGRIAAADRCARIDSPPFRSSAMDGYAFRHAEGNLTLRIAGMSTAGHPGGDTLAAGTCQRITTGARVPDDADTVVMQENVSIHGDCIVIDLLPVPGFNVRASGSDMQRGQRLVASGDRLGAAALGLLNASGETHIDVVRALTVAVLSTGDELVEAGSTLANGQIHDANRAVLLALLNDPGIIAIDLGIHADSIDALRKAITLADDADLIVSSGGVSVGDADFVRDVIDRQGKVELWKIAMKPGRPLTFGQLHGGQAWIGLPGNPVSAAVTCLMFVHRALAHMAGSTSSPLLRVSAIMDDKLTKAPGRVEYQRGRIRQDAQGGWHVHTTGAQDSHVLTSLQQADCFIELPNESSGVSPGDRVVVIPFSCFTPSAI